MKTFLCSHLIMLRWKDGETAANLETISALSATANAEQAVAVGIPVTLSAGTFELAGTIAGCQMDPSGFLLDVALERPWSPELFSPDHLLDPDLLDMNKLA